MLNTMMENEHKYVPKISIFSETTILDHSICDHDLWNKIKIIV